MHPPDLADRVAERLDELDVSANRVNQLAGFTEGYLSRIKSRQRKAVRLDLLESLAAAMRVHLEWLQRGVGPKELPPDPKGAEGLPAKALVGLRVALGRGRGASEALADLRSFGSSHPSVDDVNTPMWVEVAMGLVPPLPQEQHIVSAPRYPNREAAIHHLVEYGAGTLDEVRAAADAYAVALKSDSDLPLLKWAREIEETLRETRRGHLPTGTPVTVLGDESVRERFSETTQRRRG